jgi:hypothetical protein
MSPRSTQQLELVGVVEQVVPVPPLTNELAVVLLLANEPRPEREVDGGLGAGPHGNPQVGDAGRVRQPRVDHHQLRALLAGLRDLPADCWK